MNKKILQLALPNIVSNITVPLLGMVDIAVVGHLDNPVYVGAIALGAMIFNLIYWGFAFLRMGSSGLTAQAFGERDFTKIYALLLRGLMVAFSIALLLIMAQWFIKSMAFYLIDADLEVEQFAKQYFSIIIWSAPATLGMYSLNGWFIGMQNTKTPMVIAIFINVVNIALSLFFVKVLGMASAGVAYGTLIAQYVGFLVAVFILVFKYKMVFRYKSYSAVFDKEGFKTFFKVNRDIFIRTLSMLCVLTFFTSHSASVDTNTLAANTILLQFLFVFAFIFDGFAYAAEALSGKFYGAKNNKGLQSLIRLVFIWGAVLALIFSVAYGLGGMALVRLLTNQQSVIHEAGTYLVWVVLIPVLSVTSFIWDGIFIGITASKEMRNSMLVAVFVVFFPVWYAFEGTWNNHALWLAFVLYLFARGLIQTVQYQKIKLKLF